MMQESWHNLAINVLNLFCSGSEGFYAVTGS
jgi:hypothetical protein